MAKGYILAIVKVADDEAYKASGYMGLAEAAIKAHGGRYLVRGGEPSSLEGEAPDARIVILEFPSREMAQTFYSSEDYAPAIALRQSLSAASLVLLSGFVPTSE